MTQQSTAYNCWDIINMTALTQGCSTEFTAPSTDFSKAEYTSTDFTSTEFTYTLYIGCVGCE